MPPPETTGTAMPACLNRASARSKNSRVSGSRLGKVISPLNCRPGSAIAVRASAKASSGVCTPVRLKPVSHSTRNSRSTWSRAAAAESSRATTSLSNTTASRRTRRARAVSRSVLAAPRMLYVSSTSSATLASAKTSTSPSFWQVMPTAPAAICIWPMAGILCVLMCGRLPSPCRARCACTRRMLSAITSRWIVTAGVSSAVIAVMGLSSVCASIAPTGGRRCPRRTPRPASLPPGSDR